MKSFKVHVVSKETVKKAEAKGKQSIIAKYATVESEAHEGTTYNVVKYRKGLIVNASSKPIRYNCTCPGFMYRLIPCKHIKAFKAREKKR